MKNINLLFIISIISCTSQKNVPGTVNNATAPDTVIAKPAGNNETKAATPTKNIILNNPGSAEKKAASANTSSQKKEDKVPACLQQLVKQFMEEEVQNPPRKIYSYIYHGNLVYYVTAPCCDFFSDLYDAQCRLIAHPDGGITGRGDGRAKDFTDSKSQEKLVWEDVRTSK